MDLQGMNVLVDGYNLELSSGTGIKTYGMTLIKAARSLGANVGVLFGSNRESSSNAVLNEVLFFDGERRNIDRLELLLGMIKSQLGILYKSRRITTNNGFIIENIFSNDEIVSSTEIFNLKNCYKIANSLYKNFRISTRINFPKKIDIWHASYPISINIKKSKKVTTIHDLIPLKLPYTSLDDKKFYYDIINRSIKDSSIIVTVSENSRNDILKLFDINPDKICVTYQPISLEPTPLADEKISVLLKKYKLSFKNYILFVGAIEPKKNVGRLIDAYAGLDADIPLVIAGKKGWLWEAEIGKLEYIFGKNFSRRVKLLEFVPSEDLKCLYGGAYCLVFPSLYEGFGLPPLEAMAFGCPVITSNVASLPEVCGDAAIYVNPYDTHDIREGMKRLIDDPQMCTQLVEAGRERAKLFSMKNYMKKLYEAYAKVL